MPFKSKKICQNGLLVTLPIPNSEYEPSVNKYEKYSAKFLFIGKIVNNIRRKTVFIFKSRKLLDLCIEYIDSLEVPCKNPKDKEAEARIALFFFDDPQIADFDLKIAVDCNYSEFPCYRLVLYGTREHYFLSKKVMNQNIQKVAVAHVPTPPLISFDTGDFLNDFDQIVSESAVLVSCDFFDFQPLGISEFLGKAHVKSAIQKLCENGFQFESKPLFVAVAMSLFRSITPENAASFPLALFRLAKEVQGCGLSSFLCESQKKWLRPIKELFQTVDPTPFRELKEYFAKSADRLLQKIERKMIVMNFFRDDDILFKYELLPPCEGATLDSDKNLIMLLKKGVFPLADQKRIENIIDVMKYELLSNDFPERYIIPFWNKSEVEFVASQLADFGGFPPLYKIPLLGKSNEALQNLKADLSKQLINGLVPIKVSSSVPPSQKVVSSSNFLVELPVETSYELGLRMQLAISLKVSLEIDNKENFLNSLLNSKGTQKVNLNADSWMLLLKILAECGASSLNAVLLSPSLPFRLLLTKFDVSYLRGKFPVFDWSEPSGIPASLTSEMSLFEAIQTAIATARAAPKQPPKVAVERPVPTMPIGVQPTPSKNNGRSYSPPNELLQRAADLQNQKRHEKKKQKQVKPILPPPKNVMPHIPIAQPQFIPLPIQQQQIKEQQNSQQPPPHPQILIVKNNEHEEMASRMGKFYMPSVEIARKSTENHQEINLPPKKRPIAVGLNETQKLVAPVIQSQSAVVVEPMKTSHVRMSQAAARQMMNDEFLLSLPHASRQSGGNAGSKQQQNSETNALQQGGGGEMTTDISLLPLKKKHLVNYSPPK